MFKNLKSSIKSGLKSLECSLDITTLMKIITKTNDGFYEEKQFWSEAFQ